MFIVGIYRDLSVNPAFVEGVFNRRPVSRYVITGLPTHSVSEPVLFCSLAPVVVVCRRL